MLFAIFTGCIILSLFLLVYMIKEAFANRILHHEFSFNEFPDSFDKLTIFFISDVHRRKISKRLLKKITEKPDIVIIGGDLTEKGVPYARVTENVVRLTKIAPVYFVWGNNDLEVNTLRLQNILRENNVSILANSSVPLKSEAGDIVHLIGVDDLGKYRDRLDLAMNGVTAQGFRLLISHNPKIIEQLTPENQIQLILSGHTHGGQIRIFGYGPYELGGVKKLRASTLLVSNGYGTTGVPLRLEAKAETHFITITHSRKPINI